MAARVPVASYQSFPLTLCSWNIANAAPSFSAPDTVQRCKDSPRLIREECLRARPAQTSSPDIIALQECPFPSFGIEEFGPSGYVSMGTQQSHCGYVDLLVRKELTMRDQSAQPIPEVKQYHLPSVAATIELPNKTKISVSSSHLAPFKEGAYQRLTQCTALMELMNQRTDNCILLGDFNTRAAEDKGIESTCDGGWIDAWKGTGSNPKVKFTWDSFVNRYHEGGFKFRARFDRCYVRGEALGLQNFDFIGNACAETKGDYLSDHYGMLVGLDVRGNTWEQEDPR